MITPHVLDSMRALADQMKARAARGEFTGRMSAFETYYLTKCRQIDDVTSTTLIFTRDSGHHSSGWMKSPDYERCLHLFLSPAPSRLIVPGLQRAELDKRTTRAWLDVFFDENVRLLWAESPKSPEGIRRGVWHWRLFCDEHWQPFLPRGEVYSTEFTELGWRSASELFETEGRIVESTVDPS